MVFFSYTTELYNFNQHAGFVPVSWALGVSMSLKPKIYKAVPAAHIPKKCASEFSNFINLKALDNETYTVISYPAMRNESASIVDSKNIKKALSKVSTEHFCVVAIAHNFTEEAKMLLQNTNAVFFYKSDFYWSDASWANIRDSK
jgi:hypothetical protein